MTTDLNIYVDCMCVDVFRLRQHNAIKIMYDSKQSDPNDLPAIVSFLAAIFLNKMVEARI